MKIAMKIEKPNLKIRKLLAACRNLNSIVEGVNSVRWESHGARLKDTDEWVEFYSALSDVKYDEN